MATTAAQSMTAYKACEKRWKKMHEKDVMEDPSLLNVRALREEQRALVTQIGTWRWRGGTDGTERERPILAFTGMDTDIHEGFYIIPDAICAAEQLQIAHACLTEYVEEPHVTNMHQQNEQVEKIWQKARASHPQDPSRSPALSKLHWGAAGYHYDWTARKYYAHDYSPVPEQLRTLGASCASACGMTLAAEAVIVNFYKKNSAMGGHLDDVELTMTHPVVSLSLGSRCVFLKGGPTKDHAPLEVLLQSGDLVVLGGSSRLSYHGVARILPTSFELNLDVWKRVVTAQTNNSRSYDRSTADREPAKKAVAAEIDDEFRAVKRYIESHRININIRQVYADVSSPNSHRDGDSKRQKVEVSPAVEPAVNAA